MGIIIAILLFSFIIIFHELGHFLLAKKNGIQVDEFSLGLGPTLIGKKFGETFFCIKLLPFGGACMMGEDDVDDVSPGSFNSKSVWARMSVIAGGPDFLRDPHRSHRVPTTDSFRSYGRLLRRRTGDAGRRCHQRDQWAKCPYMG